MKFKFIYVSPPSTRLGVALARFNYENYDHGREEIDDC